MSEPDVEKTAVLETSQDVEALLMHVLREAYLQTTEDLREYAEKVSHINKQKKALREYLNSLREFKAKIIAVAQTRGTNLCSSDKKDVAVLTEIFKESAHPHEVGTIEFELCIPSRVPPVEMNSVAQLEAEITRWEDKLNSVGDDAQLANVDLQNILQKQQQTLQMMSNISKMSHDNIMAIIRKIGG